MLWVFSGGAPCSVAMQRTSPPKFPLLTCTFSWLDLHCANMGVFTLQTGGSSHDSWDLQTPQRLVFLWFPVGKRHEVFVWNTEPETFAEPESGGKRKAPANQARGGGAKKHSHDVKKMLRSWNDTSKNPCNTKRFNLSNEKLTLVVYGIQEVILPSYMGTIKNHSKDPYQTTSRMESKSFFLWLTCQSQPLKLKWMHVLQLEEQEKFTLSGHSQVVTALTFGRKVDILGDGFSMRMGCIWYIRAWF